MALPKISEEEIRGKVRNPCPKCGKELLVIDGNFIQWHTCPVCKFKKLVEKKDLKKPKVTPLK